MEFYQKNNFKLAIGPLAKAVQEDSLEGRYWLYLGISYYLDHQAAQAATALTKAESLSDPAQRNRARWYLAQAYLLEQDTVRSMPLLQSLINEGFEYSEEADSLLIRIREMPK
jgi:Flp pilus assembly protein TadD